MVLVSKMKEKKEKKSRRRRKNVFKEVQEAEGKKGVSE